MTTEQLINGLKSLPDYLKKGIIRIETLNTETEIGTFLIVYISTGHGTGRIKTEKFYIERQTGIIYNDLAEAKEANKDYINKIIKDVNGSKIIKELNKIIK